MLGQYLPLFALLVLSGGFVAISLGMSKLLAPSRPTEAKVAPYECGIVPTKEPPERFPVRFYLVAMIFVVLDVEIVFLFPWATIYRNLGTFGLVEMLVFSVAVFVSFVYLIANGALDWGPVSKAKRLASPMVSADRTARTTVRRVGLDGRLRDDSTEAA